MFNPIQFLIENMVMLQSVFLVMLIILFSWYNWSFNQLVKGTQDQVAQLEDDIRYQKGLKSQYQLINEALKSDIKRLEKQLDEARVKIAFLSSGAK